MEELRWILLIVGVGLIAGIYFLGDPKPEKNSESGDPLDEDLEKELRNLEKVVADRDTGTGNNADAAPEKARSHPSVLISNPDSILTLYLNPLGTLTKQQIFSAAGETGLEFGDLNIFHRLQTGSHVNGGQAIFSVANITKPGDFDPAAPEHLPSSGLCLFLTLPNPLSALDAWDAMLATGQRLASLLECEIQDESHCTLTRQRIAHIREQMREYDRKQAILR